VRKFNLVNIITNFLAIVFLIALIATPFYFPRNFSQVAGVKSSNPYLIVSQVEKFPDMTLMQKGNSFKITFTKQNASQAYLSTLVLNNPTDQTRTYRLETPSDSAAVFFGDNIANPTSEVTVPAGASVPISLLSSSPSSNQTVEFALISN